MLPKIPDDPITTRRSYRLEVVAESKVLYETHLAVNRGVAVALDALASLRGGLHASLALVDDPQQRRNRMLALTTCWFVAESKDDAPSAFVISSPTAERLREILASDGIDSTVAEEWTRTVAATLRAPIRDKAAWVDRRAAFDATGWPPESVGDVLLETGLLGDPWTLDDSRKAATDLVQITSAWLSRRLGRGEGADFAALARAYASVRDLADTFGAKNPTTDAAIAMLAAALGVKPTLSGVCGAFRANGHRSRTLYMLRALNDGEPTADRWEKLAAAAARDAASCAEKPLKGNRPWSDALAIEIKKASGLPYHGTARAHHGEYAVIFDHAARRLAAHHSWTLVAERERLAIESENASLPALPAETVALLDRYRAVRALEQGGYRPRARALGGWSSLVSAWATCVDAVERISAVSTAQADTTMERFGDARLFRDLAVDSATLAWRHSDGTPDPQLLATWVSIRERADVRKAPMLRHVDAHYHPVHIDYGVSRFRLKAMGEGNLEIGVVRNGEVADLMVLARSRRFSRDIEVTTDADEFSPRIARNDRLGRLAGGAGIKNTPFIVASKDIGNARLIADRSQLERIASADDDHARARLVERMRWSVDVSVALPRRPIDPRIVEAVRARRASNANRGSMARQELAGIQGLRVLGVDVGLRAAAACAVIETLGDDEVVAIASQAEVAPPSSTDSSWIFKLDGRLQRYRRLAVSGLATWARVEQTFVVRLPGETASAVATPTEIALAELVAEVLGSPYRPRQARDIVAVQGEVIAILRLAVRRTAALTAIANRLDGTPEEAAEALAALAGRIENPGRFQDREKHLADIIRASNASPDYFADIVARSEDAAKLRSTVAAHTSELRRAARLLRPLVRPQRRNLGGLSLGRIDIIERYYRALKSLYALGRTPSAKFGERTLLALRSIRRERTRVLASRIVEAALGGSRKNGAERSVSIEHEPCVAIAIENLDGYQPSVARARRTNRLLRTLRSQDFADQLALQCELHGIYLRRMPPAYTSRIDGVTGKPGVLAEQVSISALASGEWDSRANKAMKVKDARAGIVRQSLDYWNPVRESWGAFTRTKNGWMRAGRPVEAPTILIPREVGPLFTTDGRRFVNADINAAIGLAMTLVLDRDWKGAYTHVPCNADGTPNAERVKGGPKFSAKGDPLVSPQGRPVNAWSRADRGWSPTSEYWAEAERLIADEMLADLRTLSGV